MIKAIFHKSISIALAFLVFVSTLSFKVEKHYCGPFLVDIALFTSAEKCSMNTFIAIDDHGDDKSCCDDEVEILQGQDELKVNSLDLLDVDHQLFLSVFNFTYKYLFEGLPNKVIPHKDYSPPNLIRDIHVEDQVFLI